MLVRCFDGRDKWAIESCADGALELSTIPQEKSGHPFIELRGCIDMDPVTGVGDGHDFGTGKDLANHRKIDIGDAIRSAGANEAGGGLDDAIGDYRVGELVIVGDYFVQPNAPVEFGPRGGRDF